MSLPVQMSSSLGPLHPLLGSEYHFSGFLPCTVAEIGQIHTTLEISFIATDVQNK